MDWFPGGHNNNPILGNAFIFAGTIEGCYDFIQAKRVFTTSADAQDAIEVANILGCFWAGNKGTPEKWRGKFTEILR